MVEDSEVTERTNCGREMLGKSHPTLCMGESHTLIEFTLGIATKGLYNQSDVREWPLFDNNQP